ncbi:MAG: nickel-dependent lactate racemase [Lentisphaeria bacterium]|nr:nickel-dependent lactate racemase [Lentisphaeria bacterium]
MAKLSIPYSKNGISVEVPEKNLLGVYTAQLPPAAENQAEEVIRALDAPIGSEPLEKIAAGKKSAVIIASDHTRPVPSKFIIPEMLRRLRKGNPAMDITILIATGCHRKTTEAELISKFGREIVEKEKIVIHDSGNEDMLTDLGELPSGGSLKINRLAVETDLLVAEGFIEPHFFAGFSGGRKSVLPGIAARETVLANHCAEFIDSPFARTGILENNPIHKDMLFAAEKAKLAFIVNVVINGEKEIVRAFAGNREKAHEAGCRFLSSCCGISVPQADIVITSNGGYPLDQNVYQSVKGMTAGEAVCREKGVIIICAGCSDGHGGEEFFKILSSMSSPEALLKKISRVPRNKTLPDQWQYQILARILQKFTVILVSDECDHRMINAMGIKSAATPDEALKTAFEILGDDASVAVIPDGVSVIIRNR